MGSIRLELKNCLDFIEEQEIGKWSEELRLAHAELEKKRDKQGFFTGWLDWPCIYPESAEYKRIKETSSYIREHCDAFIVIGIGGSYLGARSAIEFLKPPFYNELARVKKDSPEIYFLGHNLSSSYILSLLEILKDKEVMLNVVSKSGTTLEPALAFRILRKFMEEKYGQEEVKKRIFVTTDGEKGLLKDIAEKEEYTTFVVPDEIGGRYSVLTSVGLLPIAVAGIDIDQIMLGAQSAVENYNKFDKLDENSCYQYAVIRQMMYSKAKTIEVLASYDHRLKYFSEWWKQLFGESEGKEGKGIFPASVSLTTDLHSMGQYLQDGLRQLFITTLFVEEDDSLLKIPELEVDDDKLNYLADKSIHYINEQACAGAMLAHANGGAPNIKISIPELTPYYYGQLVYFFEKACAISGYMLKVNPFDQPGVEEYKKNMFTLLEKK